MSAGKPSIEEGQAALHSSTVKDETREPGHVFISYVREDATEVDRLEETLKAAGFRVWRDVNELWPGQDWKLEIAKAINSGSLAFLACFSANSEARASTYQREELILAVEQMRRRQPGAVWLIPVRFSACDIPSYSLGAGRDLNALQRIDLFGDKNEQNIARLTVTISRILHEGVTDAPARPAAVQPALAPNAAIHLRSALHDPARQMDVEDLAMDTAGEIRKVLEDETEFPASFSQPTNEIDALRVLMATAHRYEASVRPLLELLATGCAWGTDDHCVLWARAVQVIGSTVYKVKSGSTSLLHLRRYPLTLALYAGGLGAIYRHNFASLRAITVDAKLRIATAKVAMINEASAWRLFDDDVVPSLLLRELGGTPQEKVLEQYAAGQVLRFNAPTSLLVAHALRSVFAKSLPHDDEYTDNFDMLEVYLSLIAQDALVAAPDDQVFRDGPWFGSFTWRTPRMEKELYEAFGEAGESWGPLTVGLFGGTTGRANSAFEFVLRRSQELRVRRY